MNNNISNNKIHDDDLELEKKERINETARTNFSNMRSLGRVIRRTLKLDSDMKLEIALFSR